MYLGKLVFHIISGALGLFLAAKIVPGVEFYGSFSMLLIVGAAIGLVNFFIKPFLKIISLPIRILTLGIFSLIINMAMIWLVEIIFPKELEITGLIPLFWTTLIVWALNLFFGVNKKLWKK
ncbi:MAG: phage holin family protein [bacterium]|nr:phage holin family protein [bacterium]